MVQSELRLNLLSTGDLVDGRYEVQSHLGSGGMGDVWRVQHRELLQSFALKTLKPEVQHSRPSVLRFLREARAAAALHSRYIVRMVDGRTDYEHEGVPLPFIVMEYLNGLSVEQRMTLYGPCSRPEATWLMSQLGRALQTAHSAGLVHRDVKPANVFIADGEDGEPIVKLGDFGIVKLMDDSLLDPSTMTASGTLLGTPMYMAPEQLRGQSDIGPRADQWSFAMMAFFVLTGRPYFAAAASTADLIAEALNPELRPPSQVASRFPQALDAWFLRSCHQHPEQRFADVDEQFDAFEQALGRPRPSPLHPHQVGVHSATEPPPKNLRLLATLALGTAASVAAMSAAWIHQDALVNTLMPTRQPLETSEASAGPKPRVEPKPTSAAHPPQTLRAASPTAGATPPAPHPGAPAGATSEPRSTAQKAPARKAPPKSPAKVERPAARQPKAAAPTPARLASGASCTRSAECESGLCVAETCR